MENKKKVLVIGAIVLIIAGFGYLKRVYIMTLFQKTFSSEILVDTISLSASSSLPDISVTASQKFGSYTAQKNIVLKNSTTTPLISEILVGKDGNAAYEFIELFNPHAEAIDMTGFSIRKENLAGVESPLVSAERLKNKIIPPLKYFLLAHDNGYNGSTTPDVWWAKSNTIPMTTGSIVLYDADGNRIEKVGWGAIPKNKSLTRVSWDSAEFVISSNPTPENSSGK